MKQKELKLFSDFNIKPAVKIMSGDKIKIKKILNKEIIVHDYKVAPSKHVPGTDCLHLGIELDKVRHVVFTSGTILIQQLEQVPKSNFPFKTTIINENEYYEFT